VESFTNCIFIRDGREQIVKFKNFVYCMNNWWRPNEGKWKKRT